MVKRRQNPGYATLVVLALVSFLLMLMVSGQRTTQRLKREVRLLEERQLRHWAEVGAIPREGPRQGAARTGEGTGK